MGEPKIMPHLTPRELEVSHLVSMGNAYKEIAAQLRISLETVKKHVRSIIAKLHANNRTHAVLIAAKAGLPGELPVSVGSNQSFNLTPRKLKVLQLVSLGNTNKEIAAQLGISLETVKKHVQIIISKLGANNRTHAVLIAAKAGLPGELPVNVGSNQSFNLTPRELEALHLVNMRNTNKEIAAQLGISLGTVKKHVQIIIAKLGANNRNHAALIAEEAGLFGEPPVKSLKGG